MGGMDAKSAEKELAVSVPPSVKVSTCTYWNPGFGFSR